ncbi:hypothetical protein CcI156_09210 [Frankia sp. CcI156]|jgi:hypothetical protein|uniref:Uncharacterized protein n=1 Tax=Frankia casuarinae (strain DSM 45818 / CECT 9043 / HFP020203 / CcI3) TaxID=106370 RepID=Q2JAH9_FRACC|nr:MULTISPECIES: hypothetical protein [Frankia]ABD11713.1 hypothetical protein Francci3_2346 [Frankia casuarinae]ETA03453.1 hypothetical protein CcI6DRAFT_01169 [Frankia sp. CcI6]EYT93229.1 hypothetical protein ThrDRAFT_01199 [Frankia casuarinae]KDA40648.1 hypothetical protein BMG523Draft_04545 [Frankia sp. BMG5.23]KEZ34338.1 hypothetical protein CEDDRAFT_04317 [Frankia sp. CeD]
MTEDGDRPAGQDTAVPRIGRPTGRTRTFHGPVRVEIAHEGSATQVVSFYGSEESDLLHAAGDWMNDHLYAVILGFGFADLRYDDDGDKLPPQLRLTMTVDMSYYR